jgi:hypothetical protein
MFIAASQLLLFFTKLFCYTETYVASHYVHRPVILTVKFDVNTCYHQFLYSLVMFDSYGAKHESFNQNINISIIP